MPISTIGPGRRGSDAARQRSSRCDGAAGFTLLEITLVILIISVVLALTIPRFRDPGHAELMAQAHRLELTFKLIRSEAVLNNTAYRLNFDLDQQRYWVSPHEAAMVDLAQFASDIGSLAKGTRLTSAVSISDVSLPTLAGTVLQGQVYTVFYPDGTVDPTVIHLATSKEAYTLWVDLMSSKLKVRPGYGDVSYSG